MYKNFNSHAHVERDMLMTAVCILLTNFNSHAHVERDKNHPFMHNLKITSTHTLTWSVTVGGSAGAGAVNNFNSHAHVERDVSYAHMSQGQPLFQLTRSRGA